jgi:flagellar motor switch protein FliN/FliY
MAEEQPPTPDPNATPSAADPPAMDAAPAADAAAPADATGADAIFANASFDAPADGGAAAPNVDGALADAQASIDELLKSANFEDPASIGIPAPAAPAPPTAQFDLPNFQEVMQDVQASSIELLRDVELNVKIELGRTRMLVEEVLKLGEGSVVELDKLAGDPVDVFVNDRLVARGEVLVLNDNFCVRVNEIVAGMKDEGL